MFHTVNEAADILQVHPRTIYRMIWRQEIKIIKLGRKTTIPSTELDRLLTAKFYSPAKSI